MIHSTKRDQYWSFWCWGWSDHLNQEVFWGNWAVETVEPVRLQRPLRSIWSFGCQGWSNHQDQQKIWWNEAVEVIEAIEVVEAVEVIEAADVLRTGKSLLRTSEWSRTLNSALFWCFEKKMFGGIMKNIMLNLSIFSVGGCRGQPMSLFWNFFDETQMLNIGEHANHHECFLM